METVVVAKSAEVRAPGAYDRVFYSGMAIAMAVTVFAGFAPSYYLRTYTGAPTFSGLTELPPLVHLHGVLFTAWVVFFIAQTTLVAQRRVAVHRRTGIAGVALAIAMVVVGWKTAIAAAARGATVPGVDPLSFLVIPIFDIVFFTGFVAAAIALRRNKEAHKRLMLLAYVSIIAAAVARLPGLLPYGPLLFFGLTMLFVVAGVAYDVYSRRRVHAVYVWGGILLAVSVPGRLAFSSTQAWRTFANFIVNG